MGLFRGEFIYILVQIDFQIFRIKNTRITFRILGIDVTGPTEHPIAAAGLNSSQLVLNGSSFRILDVIAV